MKSIRTIARIEPLESLIAPALAAHILVGITGASVNATGGPIGAIKVGASVSSAKIGAGTTLGTITIGGDLENSLVLAGYNFAGDAKIPTCRSAR